MIRYYQEMGFRPKGGVWELTLRCNMSCLHCGSSAGKAREQELNREELLRVADDLVELGNEHVTLSGGEPLLRAEWPEVAKRLSSRGVVVNVISNGYVFNDRVLAQGLEAGLTDFCFSVDGDESIHNLIRQRPDAYRRVMAAIELCAKHKFPVGVVTHVVKANKSYLRQMAQTLLDAGAFAWQVQLGFDYGNLSQHPELLIEPADLKEIVPNLAKLVRQFDKRLRIDAADDIGYYTEEERTFRDPALRGSDHPIDFWIGCPAGLSVIGIEASGNVKGCLSMQGDAFIEGNVRREGLKEIWNRPGAFAYTREFSTDNLGGYCRECEYNDYCRGGCSWNAYLHGRGTGKFANRYCLHQVYALEGRSEVSPFTPDMHGAGSCTRGCV